MQRGSTSSGGAAYGSGGGGGSGGGSSSGRSSSDNVFTLSEREHIVVADRKNNRIQMFVRIPYGVKAGVHFECMFPEDDATADTYHGFNGNDAGVSTTNVCASNGNKNKKKNKKKSANKDNFKTAETLLKPSDVSVNIVNGVIMVYVCDTGNHCVRLLVVDTETITKETQGSVTHEEVFNVPLHTQWMYDYDLSTKVYKRTVARRRFLLVATW